MPDKGVAAHQFQPWGLWYMMLLCVHCSRPRQHPNHRPTPVDGGRTDDV